ncbi:MAG: phospho-N-acetylmuramoyl-pentapeptide-transferase, partial [Lachnospiraceae bacterium]|nr:phospho-N-acetylmuramoyl-pentapeptide-transferase [Lachnospiraceae bacterium]
MISWIFDLLDWNLALFIRLFYYLCCGGLTCFLLLAMRDRMPCDQGRAFAVNGELSKGKTRGVGLLFIISYVACTLVYLPLSWELIVLLVLIAASMITGYLDDAGTVPWGGLKKGLLDLVISLGAGFAAWYFYGGKVAISGLFGKTSSHLIHVPAVLYILLAAALVWGAINVVNCTDGVDGLCATLSIIALGAFAFVNASVVTRSVSLSKISSYMNGSVRTLAVGMIMCLLPYLWFNASPSSMLMGDAGSRALGVLLAMLALRSGHVLLFIPFCLVFILDGGLGLLKLALLRTVKVHILKETRTPLHDHARKNLHWADGQTVFRFAI